MKVSKSSVLASAAFAGLMGGTMTRLVAAPTPDNSQKSTVKSTGKASKSKAAVEKHSCAGKNSCSGKGGCATDGSKKNMAAAAGITDKHACAGKNSCSGKGGCATDGSKM